MGSNPTPSAKTIESIKLFAVFKPAYNQTHNRFGLAFWTCFDVMLFVAGAF